jgi:hypothetical protein
MTALYTREVKAQGIDLNFTAVHHPRGLFDRQAKNAEFDSSELSASEYITRFRCFRLGFSDTALSSSTAPGSNDQAI